MSSFILFQILSTRSMPNYFLKLTEQLKGFSPWEATLYILITHLRGDATTNIRFPQSKVTFPFHFIFYPTTNSMLYDSFKKFFSKRIDHGSVVVLIIGIFMI